MSLVRTCICCEKHEFPAWPSFVNNRWTVLHLSECRERERENEIIIVWEMLGKRETNNNNNKRIVNKTLDCNTDRWSARYFTSSGSDFVLDVSSIKLWNGTKKSIVNYIYNSNNSGRVPGLHVNKWNVEKVKKEKLHSIFSYLIHQAVIVIYLGIVHF